VVLLDVYNTVASGINKKSQITR